MESRSRLEGRKAARLQGRKDLYPATGISHGVGLVPALLRLYTTSMQSTPCRDLFEEVRQLLLLGGGAQPLMGDQWDLGMPWGTPGTLCMRSLPSEEFSP